MRCRGGTCPSRRRTPDPYRLSLKWHAPIASVAALSERHADWQLLRYAFCGVKLSDLSLRGGQRPTWQSREGSCVFADSFPTMRPGTARLPRRFAPRNDTSRGTGDVSYPPAVEWPARNACSILPDNKNPRRNRGIRISVVISARSPIGSGKRKSEPSVTTRRLTDL